MAQVLKGIRFGGVVLRLVSVGGECNDGRMLRKVDVGFRGNVCKLVKPGKSNGSAVVGVVSSILSVDSNGVLCGKASVGRLSSECERGVNFLPRGMNCCPGFATGGAVRCFKCLENMGGGRLSSGIRRILESIGLCRGHGSGIGSFSKKVGRELKVTVAYMTGPRVVVFSRPAIKLSPRRETEFGGLVEGLSGAGAVMLSARVLSSMRRITSCVVLVGRKYLAGFRGVNKGSGRWYCRGKVVRDSFGASNVCGFYY